MWADLAEEVRRKAANGDLADATSRLDACGADRRTHRRDEGVPGPGGHRPAEGRSGGGGRLDGVPDGVQARLHQAELAEAEAKAKAAEEAKRRRLTVALAATVLLAVTLGGGGWLWIKADRDARRPSSRAM